MDIQSELEVYKFLQLINDNGKTDEGTELFVKHLFAIHKLDYVLHLFGKEIKVKHNEDIPYLVALENVLEGFSEHFDMFIRDHKNKEGSQEEARDIEADGERLIQELEQIQNVKLSSSLSSIFQAITPHLYTANKCLDKLRAYKYKSGVMTNIDNSTEFFTRLVDINFTNDRGKYFIFR